MGCLVANARKRDWEELTAEYGAMLMDGLSTMGTRRKHVNAEALAPAQYRVVGGDGLPQEPPVQRRQGLPSVGWSSWASSRTTANGWCR